MLNNNIEISFTKEKSPHHYNITAHSFVPKIGEKITPNPSVDMAEGILREIEAIYKRIQNVCQGGMLIKIIENIFSQAGYVLQ